MEIYVTRTHCNFVEKQVRQMSLTNRLPVKEDCIWIRTGLSCHNTVCFSGRAELGTVWWVSPVFTHVGFVILFSRLITKLHGDTKGKTYMGNTMLDCYCPWCSFLLALGCISIPKLPKRWYTFGFHWDFANRKNCVNHALKFFNTTVSIWKKNKIYFHFNFFKSCYVKYILSFDFQKENSHS